MAGNGSGDLFLAFSTANDGAAKSDANFLVTVLPNERMDPLFEATVQATEEAILNSLFKATPIASRVGRAEALPLAKLLEWWHKR